MAVLAKCSLAFVVIGSLAFGHPRPVLAQHITIDGRFSPAQTLVGPKYTIGANLGKQVGGNLFHSFGQFSLSNTPVPESATFTSTGSTGPISNVVGRVTGGSQSNINGGIVSSIPGANLYLINPSGVVFGPNATVNVSGSFHASTADYLKMSDGAKFQATNPDVSTLSAAPPAAFGFLNAQPAAISVNGSKLGPVPGTLGLVGGPVSIAGGTLTTPAGTIHVTSAAGTGEVPVDPRNKPALTVTSFGPVAITGGSTLNVSDPIGLGGGGSVFIRSGALTIDASEINADNYGYGPGGRLALRADDQLTLSNGAYVHSLAQANGRGATVILRSATGGTISADNSIVAVGSNSTGNSGKLVMSGGQVWLTNGAQLTSTAQSSGNGGAILLKANNLLIDGGATNTTTSTGIFATTSGNGMAGQIAITSGNLSLTGFSEIGSTTTGPGNSANVSLNIGGALLIDAGAAPSVDFATDDPFVGVRSASKPGSTGGSGTVTIGAGTISLNGGVIGTGTSNASPAGDVTIAAAGMLSINSGNISSTGEFFLNGVPAGTGNAGQVTVTAGNLSLLNSGEISGDTFGSGRSGSVSVRVAGQLTIDGSLGSEGSTGISSNTNAPSTGNAGDVTVTAGTLSIVYGGYISSSALGALPGSGLASIGNAGRVTVTAGQITLASGGKITSTTDGTGMAGEVAVTTPGALLLEGQGTGIAASATGSGPGGQVLVSADSVTIDGGAQIASSTAGPGNGGDVLVTTTGAVMLSGTAADGTASRITAEATQGSGGQAGLVQIAGGMVTLMGGAEVTSSTAGAGNGGLVVVDSQGPLTLTDPGSAIAALASSTAIGNAGSVVVAAPQITVTSGARIASTTAGTGAGGFVDVTTPGALLLDGQGNAGTGIAASATGPSSGSGGTVTVSANSLTVEGGAQIASSTTGPGSGGNVDVIVAGDVTLPDRGPQITAQSTGSGNSGSITVSAARVLMSNGGAISTEAATSTANGGNITLDVRDFLYLVSSQINTSVKGQTGNGGNITIDPLLAVLNHSSIIAQAIEGHGGNITITAGQFIASTDSIISASSQLGISGTVAINGPRVDVNGALVVLSSELRGRTEVLREACASRGGRPISSLVEAGRGGLPQDPEATLPALYIAGRDVNPSAPAAAGTAEPSRAVQTTAQLTMRCG